MLGLFPVVGESVEEEPVGGSLIFLKGQAGGSIELQPVTPAAAGADVEKRGPVQNVASVDGVASAARDKGYSVEDDGSKAQGLHVDIGTEEGGAFEQQEPDDQPAYIEGNTKEPVQSHKHLGKVQIDDVEYLPGSVPSPPARSPSPSSIRPSSPDRSVSSSSRPSSSRSKGSVAQKKGKKK